MLLPDYTIFTNVVEMNPNQSKKMLPAFLRFSSWLYLSLLFFASCSSDFTKNLEAVPTAIAIPNQINVVADDAIWNGPLGDSLRYYFSSASPILPQPEPIFDLKHYTAEEIYAESVRRSRRSYLIFGNIQDTNSTTGEMIRRDLGTANVDRARRDSSFNTTLARDKWAKGQYVFYLFGNDDEQIVQNIRDNFSAIARRVNDADRGSLEATVYMEGENRKLIDEVRNTFGISLRIPGDYFLAINENNTMWLRQETEFLSSNLFIYRLPYRDKSQFSKEGIKAIRDSLGLRYVSSEVEATYMRTNDVDLPMLTETIDLNGNYAMEARGIWDIVNDYMGGPFLTYLILSPDNKELIFIDGFVYAPGKKKRKYMQRLEHVLSSFRFENTK